MSDRHSKRRLWDGQDSPVLTHPGHIVIAMMSGRSSFCLYVYTRSVSTQRPLLPRHLIRTNMLRAALLMEYEAVVPPNSSALAMLPSVLEMFRIFFSLPLSSAGMHTCESSAGAMVFVRSVWSSTSGSMVSGVSGMSCVMEATQISA